MVDLAIHKTVSLALDERKSDVQKPAIDFLIALSAPFDCESDESRMWSELTGLCLVDVRLQSARADTYNLLLSRVRSQVTQFMGLLQVQSISSSVADLLSSVSRNAEGKHSRVFSFLLYRTDKSML